MLNTELHTPHFKQDRRMKLENFIKNFRGVDDGGDIDREILSGCDMRAGPAESEARRDGSTQSKLKK
jgi:IQ motif/SEC7 domain-containing protein